MIFNNTTFFRRKFYVKVIDLNISFMEMINSVDWDSKCKSVAEPLGYSLTLTFFIIRLIQDNVLRPNYKNIYQPIDAFDLKNSRTLKKYPYLMKYAQTETELIRSNDWYHFTLGLIDKISFCILAFLLTLNIAIASHVIFNSHRSYIFYDVKDYPSSKNIITRPITDLDDDNYDPKLNFSIWQMLKTYVADMLRKKKTEIPIEDMVEKSSCYYQLNKWTPSKFLLTVFSTFSPISVVSFCFTEVSFASVFPILLQQILVKYLIFGRYESRLNDEKLINKKIIQEMENKIIKPRMSKVVQDVKIDATGRDTRYLTQFFPTTTITKSHIFSSHDIKGKVCVQRFNEDSKTFDDIANEKMKTRNSIFE